MKSSLPKRAVSPLLNSRSILELIAARHINAWATILDSKGQLVQDGNRKPHVLTQMQTYLLSPGYTGVREHTTMIVCGLNKGESYPKGVYIPFTPDEYCEVTRMRIERNMVYLFENPQRLLALPHTEVLPFLRKHLMVITHLQRKQRADAIKRMSTNT
ncbi:MAG: hypothetical protein KBE09_02740 [Candidatus Pacebacteria bacterium]|nr:hypothetical protein [Candidatus Paceibacterota bacterium]